MITGAPVENMDFEAVDYWAELCQIMDWSKTHVHSKRSWRLSLCSAQALEW